MPINFDKNIPNELYIDDFSEKKKLTLSYDGPATIKWLIEKSNGSLSNPIDSHDDPHDRDNYMVVEVDATKDTDVAYYLYTMKDGIEREHATETLPDGSTHDYISNPRIQDYYSISYDLNENTWEWSLILREKKNPFNYIADKYRAYVNAHIDSVTDAKVKKSAQDYLKTLDTFESTGMGAVYSWKLIEINPKLVPIPPVDFIAAVGVLP
jgi:hypothetical protein